MYYQTYQAFWISPQNCEVSQQNDECRRTMSFYSVQRGSGGAKELSNKRKLCYVFFFFQFFNGLHTAAYCNGAYSIIASSRLY